MHADKWARISAAMVALSVLLPYVSRGRFSAMLGGGLLGKDNAWLLQLIAANRPGLVLSAVALHGLAVAGLIVANKGAPSQSQARSTILIVIGVLGALLHFVLASSLPRSGASLFENYSYGLAIGFWVGALSYAVLFAFGIVAATSAGARTTLKADLNRSPAGRAIASQLETSDRETCPFCKEPSPVSDKICAVCGSQKS